AHRPIGHSPSVSDLPSMPDNPHPTPEAAAFARFSSQRTYYSEKSRAAKRLHYCLKVPEVLVAIGIPVLALLERSPVVLGVAGAAVAALAALQEILQPNANWIKYRTANERLKSEKALLDAKAGRYEGARVPTQLFAARVEEIVADENAGWTRRMEAAG